MKLPNVIGNKEFFRKHAALYMRVVDGRCPICNSTILTDSIHANISDGYQRSGLCIVCAKHYGHNLSRALYKYEHELWTQKCEESRIKREAGISKLPDSPMLNKHLPFKIPGARIYPPKIEPSYVIENRDISRPPAPKYTPKNVSAQKVRKYLADKEAGVI